MMFHFGIFSNTLLLKQSKKTKIENFSHYQRELKWQNAFVMVYFIWTRRCLWPIAISNSGPFSQCFVLFSRINFSSVNPTLNLSIYGLHWKCLTQKYFDMAVFWKSYSNILINVYKDDHNMMKWKSGKNHPKSVVITDFGISLFIRKRASEYGRRVRYKSSTGTAGWAPPEQWLGDDMEW